MKLTLYNNFSENNKLDKTISKIVELEGSLLDSTSIINPVITIFFKPEDYKGYVVDDNKIYITFNGLKITWDSFIYNYVLSANYAKIDEFNRYYFISDIVSVRTNLWRLSLNCDVLMSYKDKILDTTAFISRNEFLYNNDLVDNLRDYKYTKKIDYLEIINKTTVDKFVVDYQTIFPRPTYLVAVSADDAQKQRVEPTHITDDVGSSLHLQIDNIFMKDRNLLFYCSSEVNPFLFKAIYESASLRSFVRYLKVFPFNIETSSFSDTEIGSSTPDVGKWTTKIHIGDQIIDTSALLLKMPKYNIINLKVADFILDEIIEYKKSYLNSEPYYMVEIWMPFYNYVKLPYAQIHEHNLQVYYLTTISDGSTTAIIYDKTDDKILFSSKVECGVDIPYSTTNAYENEKKKDGLMISTAVGVLSSALSLGFGIGTANPMMMAGGVMGGVSTVTKAITQANQIFESANVASSSFASGSFNSLKCYVKITKQVQVDNKDEDHYANIYGKPLKEIHKLSELSGMTIVDDEHLEKFGSALEIENDKISSLLKTGIIL